jgi:predicted nucleic acid-binding protein
VGLSLVDAVSFLLMREEGIDEAFAYDRHFEREGFAIIA